jgi:hypothetical protein
VSAGPPSRPAAPTAPLGIAGKARLLAVIWLTAARVVFELRRVPLPAVVDRLSADDGRGRRSPALLSRAVSRGLRIGPWVPRCLIRTLVLYRLLRAQGEEAVVVIGLPGRRPTPDAHAWVELDGRDMGPDPGAAGHLPLARYPTDPAG